MCDEAQALVDLGFKEGLEQGRIMGRIYGRIKSKIDGRLEVIIDDMIEVIIESVIEDIIEGRAQVKSEITLNHINALMSNLKISAEQAMQALNIPASEQGKYLALL